MVSDHFSFKEAHQFTDVMHRDALCHGRTQICQLFCHFVNPETGIQSSNLQNMPFLIAPLDKTYA